MTSELDSLKIVYKKAKDFLKFMDDSYSNTHTDGDKEEEIRSNLVLAIRNYEKQKRKKKVKLYRYILKNMHTNLYCVNHWQSESPGNYHYDFQVVGTEEMEVEVDE